MNTITNCWEFKSLVSKGALTFGKRRERNAAVIDRLDTFH